jgi:hypothetical protein
MKKLFASEWLLVGSLLMILASLVVIAKVNTHKASGLLLASAPAAPPVEMILVTIEGAVSKPGTYEFPVGSRMGDVLKKARPKPFANLKNLSLAERVDQPLNLKIEELAEISVQIIGAVTESVELVLPMGVRICDLKSKISLRPEADKQFFKKRRRLRDGEVLEIPAAP